MENIKAVPTYPNFQTFWKGQFDFTGYPVQIQIGNDLFDEQCCGLIRHYGKCSRCNKPSIQQQGFVCLAGQRGGKTTLNSIIAAYQLHRLLAIENLLEYYKLVPKTKIHMVFTGDAWDNFYTLWKHSSLLTSYEHLVQPKYMVEYPNILCHRESRPKDLKNKILIFTTIDDYAWLNADLAKDYASVIKKGNSVLLEADMPIKPITIFSGSVKDANDPLMKMFAKPVATMNYYKYASWEINPKVSRKLFLNDEIEESKDWERNYAIFKYVARKF